jgi:hypothetical protein
VVINIFNFFTFFVRNKKFLNSRVVTLSILTYSRYRLYMHIKFLENLSVEIDLAVIREGERQTINCRKEFSCL